MLIPNFMPAIGQILADDGFTTRFEELHFTNDQVVIVIKGGYTFSIEMTLDDKIAIFNNSNRPKTTEQKDESKLVTLDPENPELFQQIKDAIADYMWRQTF